MPQRLLVLNVVLGLVSLAFAVGIVRTLVVKHPLPSARVHGPWRRPRRPPFPPPPMPALTRTR